MALLLVEGGAKCSCTVDLQIAPAVEESDVSGAVNNSTSIRIIDPLKFPKWNDLVCLLPNHSIFYSANWATVLSRSYGYTPKYFVMYDGEALCALVPMMEISSILTGRRGVSLPFTDYCDSLAPTGISSQTIFHSIVEYGKSAKWKYIEFRGEGAHRDVPCCAQYLRHVLPLSSNINSIVAGFRDSTRRNIQKAYKAGVKVGIYDNFSAMEAFCRLNGITRKHHGMPPQPTCFFRNVYECIVSQGLGKIILAMYEGEVIAGAVFFHMGEQALYKYGASDRRFQDLRANNLVIWEAIKWYAERDYQLLCFGRTDCEVAGLRQFKKGWGAEEKLIKYYRYDPINERFYGNCSSLTHKSYWMFRTLPVGLSEIAGRFLYRHMG